MKFHLTRVRLNAGGYDSSGAYWGIDCPLYYFTSELGEVTGHVRGATRDKAKDAVREQLHKDHYGLCGPLGKTETVEFLR